MKNGQIKPDQPVKFSGSSILGENNILCNSWANLSNQLIYKEVISKNSLFFVLNLHPALTNRYFKFHRKTKKNSRGTIYCASTSLINQCVRKIFSILFDQTNILFNNIIIGPDSYNIQSTCLILRIP